MQPLSRRRRPAGGVAWLAFGLALLVQLATHHALPPPRARAEDLAAPPSDALAHLLAGGDDPALGRGLMLALQAYDVQPGISLPFRVLDYPRVIAWLRLVLVLDPVGQYPLLSAAHLYAEIPDPVRTRQMLDFIAAEFRQDPGRRWPWMAHAVILARHRLHDQELALTYARELREHIRPGAAPEWAREMEALALADLGRKEAARVLLGGLLASGTVTEPHERHFLVERLQALEHEADPKTPSDPAARPGTRAPAGAGGDGSTPPRNVENPTSPSDFRR